MAVNLVNASDRERLKRRLESAIDTLLEHTPARRALELLSSPTDLDALIAFVNQPDVVIAARGYGRQDEGS